MAKGLYHYIGEAWKNSDRETRASRLIEWRAGDSITKVDKPLRLDRARALGYKAKNGFMVLRVRLIRGGRRRKRTGVKGRKAGRKQTIRKILKMNYQWVAEMRAARAYPTLEVLSSYNIGKDGRHFYFDVIMVDPTKPEILNDPTMRWIANPKNRKRAERGITSAGKKSRGLRNKSHDIKVRPSMRAWRRRGK